MGWGTSFCADNLCLSRQHFNSKDELEESIEEDERLIDTAEQDILSIASATPKDISPSEEDPLDYVIGSVREQLEFIQETCIEKYIKELLLDNWDTKTDC